MKEYTSDELKAMSVEEIHKYYDRMHKANRKLIE